jgi:Fe-S cluster biogenesis protein NfuA
MPQEGVRQEMARDPLVGLVVLEVSEMLAPEGGSATLLSVEDGVARISYRMGHNDACETCVMPPEDMQDYLRDMLTTRAPYIHDVEIVEED